jgi:uncharacterized protein (DUF934 family)
MATLVKQRRVTSDTWQRLDPASGRWLQVQEDGLLRDFPADGDLLVPLALWRAREDDLRERRGRVGVQLEPGDDPAGIADSLGRLALIAVNFPKFGDGRGYSIARLLRERYGYKGELRAVGQVTRDHLFFMESCGFDSFLLRDGEDPEEALAGFSDFSEVYQASVSRPQPLFRRRSA